MNDEEPIAEDPDEFCVERGFNLLQMERLSKFAHRMQCAFADPGQENDPLDVDGLGRLADRILGLTEHAAVLRTAAKDLSEARALLDKIAEALNDPKQAHADLPARVEALRLQRDRLQARGVRRVVFYE